MTIRPFHPKDRAAIDELAIKLHAYFAQVDDMAESLPFASLRDAHGYMQRMIDDSDDMDGAIYVAEENGQVVGFIQGVIIDHQPGQDAVFDAVHTPREKTAGSGCSMSSQNSEAAVSGEPCWMK